MTTSTTVSAAMPRPRVPADAKRSRIVGTKVTEREGAAWDAVRRRLGGPVRALSDSDALRFAMAEVCRANGVPWPDDDDVEAQAEALLEEAPALSGGPSKNAGGSLERALGVSEGGPDANTPPGPGTNSPPKAGKGKKR